jgi:hypothetical protein
VAGGAQRRSLPNLSCFPIAYSMQKAGCRMLDAPCCALMCTDGKGTGRCLACSAHAFGRRQQQHDDDRRFLFGFASPKIVCSSNSLYLLTTFVFCCFSTSLLWLKEPLQCPPRAVTVAVASPVFGLPDISAMSTKSKSKHNKAQFIRLSIM